MLQRNRIQSRAKRRAGQVWQAGLIFSLLFVTAGLNFWPGSAPATASAHPITSPAGNNILVTNTRDDGFPAVIGSLRRAIETTAASSGDTITFDIPTSDPGYNQATGVFTIRLTRGSLNLFKSLTINGPGADKLTISAEGIGRALFISTPPSSQPNQRDVTITDLTITNGKVVGANGTATIAASKGTGGAIYSESTGALNLTGVTFANNHIVGGNAMDNPVYQHRNGAAAQGGAIFNGSGALNLLNCTFSGNSAIGGKGGNASSFSASAGSGGAGQGGAVYNSGTLTVSNSTFTNNSVTGGAGGGGVQSEAGGDGEGGALFQQSNTVMVVADSRFTANTATGGKGGDYYYIDLAGDGGKGQGGGISIRAGSLQLTNSQFTENVTQGGKGGAVQRNCLNDRNLWPTAGSGGNGEGGSLYVRSSTAAVVNGTFSNNKARSGSSGGPLTDCGATFGFKVGQSGETLGGAINATGLNLTSSTLSGNNANRGGAIYGARLNLTNSLLDTNTAGRGAGVYAYDALTMTGSTLSRNNVGAGAGGGIYASGALTVMGSTLANNRAGTGGGLFAERLSAGSVIRNSTISHNEGFNAGGGICNIRGSLLIDSCTLVFNTGALGAPGFSVYSLENVATEPEVATHTEIRNSIVASVTQTSPHYSDVDAVLSNGLPVIGTPQSLTSGGYNLIGYTNAIGIFTAPGDQTGVSSFGSTPIPLNPLVGPLADNGGPTQTHTLLPGSPAIDKGNSFGLTTDQRGRPRPYNSGLTNAPGDLADIGAFELQPSPCATIALNPTSLPGGAAGASYYQTITAQGGASPHQFAVTQGSLPSGLTLSPEGLLSGALRSSGVYNFTITATDNAGCNGSQNYSIEIPCQIVTAALSGGGTISPGGAATLTVSLAGGAAPYTVSLNNNGGTLTGNSPLQFTVSPTATTTYTISSATEAGGCPVTASGSATVTIVSDTTPPTLTCPGNQTGVISGTTGPVAYPAPTVSDNLPGATFNCAPTSVSNFALGTTTVNCTARDAAGNTAACSFTVTLRQPRPATKHLIALVRSSLSRLLTPAQVNGLMGQLEMANTYLERGQTAPACTHLQNFRNQLNGFISGGQVPAAQGQVLLEGANWIRVALGCN